MESLLWGETEGGASQEEYTGGIPVSGHTPLLPQFLEPSTSWSGLSGGHAFGCESDSVNMTDVANLCWCFAGCTTFILTPAVPPYTLPHLILTVSL